MNISADQGSGHAHENRGLIGPILTLGEYKLEPSVLRPLAHSLGLTPGFCPKIPHNFAGHVLDQLLPPRGTWSPFSDFVEGREEESSRIGVRALLEGDYQHGVRGQINAATSHALSEERHVALSSITPKFAHGATPKELVELLKASDLARVVLPVIDSFINDTNGYLTERIPPHVGHGQGRSLCFAKPEVVEEAKNAEALQDRGSASALLQRLKDFITSGSSEDFTLLIRKFSNCGDWLLWMSRSAPQNALYPEAEQVLANTIIRLSKFKEFTRAYEAEYMTPGATNPFVRWQWSEPCPLTHRIDPLAYPLMAAALEILTREEFKHL